MNTLAGKQRAFRDLEVEKISLPDMDLREEIDAEKLDGLSETIEDIGVLQPVTREARSW